MYVCVMYWIRNVDEVSLHVALQLFAYSCKILVGSLQRKRCIGAFLH